MHHRLRLAKGYRSVSEMKGRCCEMNLVMFDYDGVIVDSLETCYSCFADACQETGLMEIASKEEFLVLFDHNLYQSMADRGLDHQAIDQILAVYEEKQSPLLDSLELFPGIAQALSAIAGNNKVVIITSNLSHHTRQILAQKGVTCCAEVIGADDEKSKIKKIARAQLAYPDLPSFYVGDTMGDMVEGHQAGVNTVGVLWGWHRRERLVKGGADYLVNTPEEMVGFFAGMAD